MQQHGCLSQTLCYIKEVRHKENTVQFHFYCVQGQAKLTNDNGTQNSDGEREGWVLTEKGHEAGFWVLESF